MTEKTALFFLRFAVFLLANHLVGGIIVHVFHLSVVMYWILSSIATIVFIAWQARKLWPQKR